jgi:hypothetical protein
MDFGVVGVCRQYGSVVECLGEGKRFECLGGGPGKVESLPLTTLWICL